MADGDQDDSRSDALDETPGDHPAFERRSLPDGDDFDEGLEDDGREGRSSLLSDTPGLAIAAASFVPTFLIVFFGVPYLLGEPSLATTSVPSPTVATAPVLEPEPGWSLGTSLSEALRGGPLERLVVPPSASSPAPAPSPSTPAPPQVASKAPEAAAPESKAPEPPAAAPAPAVPSPAPASTTTPSSTPPPAATAPIRDKSPSADAVTREARAASAAADQVRSREQAGERMPGTGGNGSHGSGSDSAPSLPPTAERVPEPERKVATSKPVLEPRGAPMPRHAVASPDPPRAQSESRKSSGDWTPAAAFADREAATRLASSIERQGYPVEIRQEASSTRPWVVWIGSQPSGGGRRR